MKKLNLLLTCIILSFISSDLNGQALFQKSFGGTDDAALDIKSTTDGGSIITGDLFTSNGSDICLLKLNVNGDTTWTSVYGTPSEEFGTSVLQTIEGGYLISGSSNTGILLKVDSIGNLQWQKQYGVANKVGGSLLIQTLDSNYLLIGKTISTNISLIKFNINGDTLWTKNYLIYNAKNAKSIAFDNHGGYLLLANTNGAAEPPGFIVIRVDNMGDTIWTKSFSTTYFPTANEIINIPTGGYLITGHSGETIFITKLDETGNIVWNKRYHNMSSAFSEGLVLDATGDIVIVGKAQKINHEDLILIKLDSNGVTKFSRLYGRTLPNENERALAIAKSNDGAYYICGSTGGVPYRGFILKVDSSGLSNCNDTTEQIITSSINFVEDPGMTTSISLGLTWSNSNLTMSRGISFQNNCLGIGISEIKNKQLEIFPNPSYGLIELRGIHNKGQLQIYNQCGQLIFTQEANENTKSIHLKGAPGYYFLRYIEGERIYINKIVKIENE